MSTIFQEDGAYANLVTGLGNAQSDKDESTRVIMGLSHPNYDALAAQYVKDGIVKRLSMDPVVKALKSPIVINDDRDDATYKELSRIGFFNTVIKAGTWSRLFGGALVVEVYENDGDADLSKPAPSGNKVVEYRVYSPGRIILTETDLNDDPKSSYFGKVEVFPVNLRNGRIIHIHASRCHVFNGIEAPDLLDNDILCYVFGCSVVDMANIGLKKLPGAFGAISNMLQENGLSVFGLNGLAGMLANDDNGVSKVRERMTLMKLGMSTMRGIVQDKDDTFEMKSHSMSDVPESIKMLMAYTSALTGIPVSILFGNMVSGLSSTNEGDIRQYDDLVEQWRQATLYKPMCSMITSFRNRNENKPGLHDFQFGEVSQATPTEKAELRAKTSDFCKTMYDIGAMTPKEIRDNMLVNGGTDSISVKSAEPPKS
ncbi:MAG: DUF1073 domain-containing protein [Fibrobacter sp.]|nr:DUF1073 domain-containing protein [Fibrobacter sp.]